MSDVSILFVHKGGFLGKLISLLTFGYRNHVAVRVGDYVYEMDVQLEKFKLKDNGLCKIYYKAYLENNSVEEHILEEVDLDDALAFHIRNKDRKYDLSKSLTWITRKFYIKDNESKWNCVEHVLEFLEDVNVLKLPRKDNISPSKLLRMFQ